METRTQTAALVTIKRFGDSLGENEMKDALYAIVRDLPGIWKNPRYIGQGGNSVLILAYEAGLGEDCAIKVALPIHVESARKKTMFDFINKKLEKERSEIKTEYESRFARGCKIQNFAYMIAKKNGLQKFGYIPEIYMKPRHNEILHYAMEYIEAVEIVEYCKTSSIDEILCLFKDVMFFINECLHKNGIVHSDLKPDNILVTKTGLPVIIDFGISKILTEKEQEVTHELSKIGNDKFMSPQQASFSKGRVRSDDIFTLGYTFWTMITKYIPVVPAGLKFGKDIKYRDLFPVSEIPRELEEFRDFFLKATGEERSSRFPNLDVAIENFDKSYNFWCKKNNTVVQSNTTNIVNKFSRVNWEEARKGIKDKKNENALFDIMQGLELLFFGDEEK